MTNLIKVKFDGAEIWIETDEEAAEAAAVPERVSVLEKAEKFIPFEKVSDTIRAYCTGLVKTSLIPLNHREQNDGWKPSFLRVEQELKE